MAPTWAVPGLFDFVLSFGQSVPLAFIAHFGLRKAVSRAETRFDINGERENCKSLKLGLFQN